MWILIKLFGIIASVHGTMVYMPAVKDPLISELMLRELIDRMGSELVDAADSYLEYQDTARGNNEYEKDKEIPLEIPLDYDALETLNPNLSIRDQEYLQHSTLNSHQRLNQNDDSKHRIQLAGFKTVLEDKSENVLPAYCTPPNPCPIGYTNEHNCLEEFENTAAFSRDYQSAQECMCDAEHMIDCPTNTETELLNVQSRHADFDQIIEGFQETNPFFRGEKLPIAAKKGTNVIS